MLTIKLSCHLNIVILTLAAEVNFLTTNGPEPKYFYIHSGLDPNLVLDLDDSDPCAGAKIVLNWMVEGKQSQIWSFHDLTMLKNNHSGLFLDVKGGKNAGSQLIAWYKNGGVNQQWAYNHLISGFVSGMGMVLDVKNHKKAEGQPLIVYPYHGRTNQKFFVTDAYRPPTTTPPYLTPRAG